MRIVWRKFKWQKIGRFWLYYYHPATSEWRYAKLSSYFKVRRDVVRAKSWNDGFRSGRNV